jgi:hypothetical protein
VKTYSDSHWVTDVPVSGKTSLEVVEAISSDLSDAKNTLYELVAHHLVSGTDSVSQENVQGIMEDVYDTPLNKDTDAKYYKAQAQSAYVIAVAARELSDFFGEAAKVMVDDITANEAKTRG